MRMRHRFQDAHRKYVKFPNIAGNSPGNILKDGDVVIKTTSQCLSLHEGHGREAFDFLFSESIYNPVGV